MIQSENLHSAHNQMNAHQAFKQFFKPPLKKSLSEAEQKLLEQADIFLVPGNAVELTAFSWGEGPLVLLDHGWGGYGVQLGCFMNPLVK